MATKKKMPAILMADDMGVETPEGKRRSDALRTVTGSLAEAIGADVHLLHAEPMPAMPFSVAEYRQVVKSAVKDRKQQLSQKAKASTVGTKHLIVEGRPATEILKASRKKPAPELIAMGTQGRTGIRRLILGSVAEEVIRGATVPVLVVGPKAAEKASRIPAEGKARMLVATDLTPSSSKAERFALELAEILCAEVTMLYCLYDGLHPVMKSALSVPTGSRELHATIDKLHKDAERALERRLKPFKKAGLACRAVVDRNHMEAPNAIVADAFRTESDRKDLVVIGTHARGPLEQAFLGSTARAVILDCAAPVIAVPPRAKV